MTTTTNTAPDLGQIISDLFDAGVERFGSVDAFQAALTAYNAQSALRRAQRRITETRAAKSAAWDAYEAAMQLSHRTAAYRNALATFEAAECAHEIATREVEQAARAEYPNATFHEIRAITLAA